jgi:diguanylate cyclase (GGDEF)-like protein
MAKATKENVPVGLPPTCILIRRDGVEAAIEDSTAPIHDRHGRVTGAVMVFHDVSSARALTLKLAYIAQHDTLTDLPNRALLNDRLSQAIALAQRHHTALALLYLDLDRFKHINESLGHLVGDRLLQSVALRLTECVRATDTVSRLGGDEFVILLSEVAHEQDAAISADKLLQTIRKPYVLDDHELHVTASIGIVVHPGDGTAVESLLQNADSAMYEAKNRGRNNYQFYRSDLNSSASARQSLESALRHAIERKELRLHYQPIVNLTSGAIAGVEALIRWRHPTLGVMLPDQFISIAEESGLIVPIGRWVLREACRQGRAWRDAGLPDMRLAVNISAVELRSPEFVGGVQGILGDTGFDPKWLEFELTETYLMQDSKSTSLVLSAIKELGVQLALDDFGTGYSSLSYMRRFPIDTLKVDHSFVRDLAMDASDASVVSAVINMGRSLHMRVVAEGVEAMDQLSFLREHGCNEAQGYYFSPPMKPSDFAEWTRCNAAEHAGV